MDTSYVAVGTVIYMITDSLTCRPQEKPRRSGAIVKSVSGVLPICGHQKVSVSRISRTSEFVGVRTDFTGN